MAWNVATLAALTLVIGLVVSLLKPTLERFLPPQHPAHDSVLRVMPPGLGAILSLAAPLLQPLLHQIVHQTAPVYTPLAAGTAPQTVPTVPAALSLLSLLATGSGGILCGLLSLVVYWVYTRMRAPQGPAGSHGGQPNG